MNSHRIACRGAIAAAGATALLLSASGAASAVPGDKETTTSLVASATSITLGDSVDLSGAVTWLDDDAPKGVKDGTVTVKQGDADCTPSSLTEVGSKSFVNSDAETGGLFGVTDTPSAAGTYGYVASYGGGTHGGRIGYTASDSACVQVTVTADDLRDAPAWANEYMRSDSFDESACVETWGANYHGEVIRHIAHTYEGQSFATWDDAAEAGVFAEVDEICGAD